MRTAWDCLCDCGETTNVLSENLKSGRTKSCGCLASEETAARNTANAKHGLWRTPEHQSWSNMRNRCLSPSNPDYHNYGGRGIKVCDPWLNDFPAFLRDMGPKPPMHTLERKESNGNYEPGNCIWATPKQQANNTRRNRKVTVGNRTQNMSQWAEEVGIDVGVIWHRLSTGWSAYDAVMTPAKSQRTA